jgi:hypothetical protein
VESEEVGPAIAKRTKTARLQDKNSSMDVFGAHGGHSKRPMFRQCPAPAEFVYLSLP